MSETLEYRGPNANGIHWCSEHAYVVGLGHRRLSIIDLSEAGNQPMTYQEFTIVYNGEIYNYQEVKALLSQRGHHFRTDSDTEVVLHAFAEWGEACVDFFIGMFAFVIYDNKSHYLYCCRDRAGVKPFYYYYYDGLFLFGSELKALMSHPDFIRKVDENSLETYFQYGYVPSPRSIFEHTFKLNPGTWLKFNITTKKLATQTYWKIAECYAQTKYAGTYDDAIEQLDQLLTSAVNYRMVSDVPVGVFLSGGYDSSLVTAKLQQDRTERIKTFTIGFTEGNDESDYARQVAGYLGTDHHELICTEQEAKELIPRLPFFYDEPFSDSSAIPTMLVSRFARSEVTVALSADGGDELFSGYNRYQAYLKYCQNIPNSRMASGVLRMGLNLMLGLKLGNAGGWQKKAESLSFALQHKDKTKQALHIFKSMNSAPNFYLDNLLRNHPNDQPVGFDIDIDWNSLLDIALCNDYFMYLQNDILTKVDRASMSYSLEGREPLIDHRLIEFAATLPDSFKVDHAGGKRILKDIVHKYIPRKLMERPKAGFSVPIDSWLRGDFQYLIDEYLDINKFNDELFRPNYVKQLIHQYKRGKLYFPVIIWRLLVYQMWSQQWKIS